MYSVLGISCLATKRMTLRIRNPINSDLYFMTTGHRTGWHNEGYAISGDTCLSRSYTQYTVNSQPEMNITLVVVW